MQKYVLGFAFDLELDYVCLIEKQKPDWQKGKLNGIGGKVEVGESSRNAMVREFREETGVDTNGDDWDFFAKLTGDNYEMHCFRIRTNDVHRVATMEIEQVDNYRTDLVLQSGKTVHSMHVLLPLAMDDNFYFSQIRHIGKD